MRLLSYNIHKGIGGRDRLYRLDRIIQVIQAEDPDFICLQEVDRHLARSRHEDQPRRAERGAQRNGTPLPEQRAAQERWVWQSRCCRAGHFANVSRSRCGENVVSLAVPRWPSSRRLRG